MDPNGLQAVGLLFDRFNYGASNSRRSQLRFLYALALEIDISAMARFFFDIDDSICIRDNLGSELADRNQAQAEAFRRAAAYAGNSENLQESGAIVVTVRDGPQSVALVMRLVCQVEVI